MLQMHRLVFDEYVVGNTAVYTDQALNKYLAQCDRLAIHAIVDNITVVTSDAISVIVEHSADGITFFTPKNVQNEIASNNTFTGPPIDVWGFDLGVVPSLDQVHLKISFGVATTRAHVRIHVAGRCPKPFF